MIKTIQSLRPSSRGGIDHPAGSASTSGNIKKEETTMPSGGILHPHKPEFERFLHASVGEDRVGDAVTVFSALARLDLEPWEEAPALAALENEAAGSRLEMLLSQFRDVPALKQDYRLVARELIRLPERRERCATISGTVAKGPAMSSGVIWMVLAILFLAMQMVFAGAPGSGQ
ncbi:hypothetical protein FGK63_08555 [Ruegeria sediminis]|uniref:Uncharacterized protein n=1 Tax=Ruegeria sediminis TaxID=2583820 RepID=A0ABY2X2I5_9RHOB|nr:hypothetical protein [Ruegeria sediminis]TMV09147.1 hypothetical protein FGK63_08555 [Ruegeria sediminis]